MTATAGKTSLKNNHLGNGDHFVIIASVFLASFIVDRARCKGTGRSAIEVNIENERLIGPFIREKITRVLCKTRLT